MPRRPLKLILSLLALFFFILHLAPKFGGGASQEYVHDRVPAQGGGGGSASQKQKHTQQNQQHQQEPLNRDQETFSQYPPPPPPAPPKQQKQQQKGQKGQPLGGAGVAGRKDPFGNGNGNLNGNGNANGPAQAQAQKKPLGKHEYRHDGLLDVNLEGPHPIYELMKKAEEEWAAKHAKASTTLSQAVAEYKRRYKRNPPKGFDKWWKYVQDHQVLLPDEYDQIYRDLEPFFGLEPSDLIEIHKANEKDKESYTFGKDRQDDPITVLTYAFTDGRYNDLISGAAQIIDMYKDIGADLPPFRMTYTPDDRPNRHTDYGVKEALLEAASARTFVERSALPKITHGWTAACPPNSPARRRPITLDNPPPRPTKKTFIHDHPKSMDPCYHPHLFYQHGQFTSHETGPWPQNAMVPEFAFCSTLLHHNIRFPTPYAWMEDIYPRSDDPDFDLKQDHRLLWRGSNTGIYASTTTRWKQSQRFIMVDTANELKGTVQVVPSNRTRRESVGELMELRKALVNPGMMDIAFAGRPISCAPDVCKVLEEMYTWKGKQTVKDAGNYRFVLDVDGNGWSGRFKRLMTSNSLIMKATIYPEWFVDRVAPWLHYVPVQVDLSDVYDVLVFFRGDGNGDGAHEDLAKKIAVAGREWSKRYWRKEDLIAYAYRLTLEYIRLLSPDREAMTYQGRRK